MEFKSVPSDPIARALVQTCLEFYRRRPWIDVDDGRPFILEMPKDEHPMVATILGCHGLDHGIQILCGPTAFEDAAIINRGQAPPRSVVRMRSSLLGFSMLPRPDLRDDDQRILARSGVSLRRESLAPAFMAKGCGEFVRGPKRGEQKRLTWSLRAVLEALRVDILKPLPLDAPQMLVLKVSGSQSRPAVAARMIANPCGATKPLPDADPAERFLEAVSAAIEAVEPRRDPTSSPVVSTSREADQLPKTPGAWRPVQYDVGLRLGRDLVERKLMTRRNEKVFFGVPLSTLSKDLSDAEVDFAENCFMDWAIYRLRPTRVSETVAERALRTHQLSAAERALIEGFVRAKASIFRIEALEPGTSVTIRNILDGSVHVVPDRSLSHSARVGMGLVSFLASIGSWLGLAPISPPLNPAQIDIAMDFLEKTGVVFGASYIEQNVERVGRLWSWIADRSVSRPEIKTTDGFDIVPVTAWFDIVDGDGLIEALHAHPMIDHHPDENQFALLARPLGPDEAGTIPIRATFDFLGDTLEVGSMCPEHLTIAREILEETQTVRFSSMKRDGSRSSMTPDDRLPNLEPRDPDKDSEIASALADFMLKQDLAWLDTSIPALDGLTPREAVKTSPAYRRKVERLLRTSPPPMGPRGIVLPSNEPLLRRELGLDED